MLANSSLFYNYNNNEGISDVFHSLISSIGIYYAGIQLTAIDLSPNHAGTLIAIANSLSSLTNIIIPYINKYITKSVSSAFQVIFYNVKTVLSFL